MDVKLKLNTNPNLFSEATKPQIYEIFVRNAPQLQRLAQKQVKQSYAGYFTKNPKDTGTAQSNTKASIEAQLRPDPTIKVIFEILNLSKMMKNTKSGGLVNYALFFAEPLQSSNPNFKYGKRNTVLSSRDLFAKALGINQ